LSFPKGICFTIGSTAPKTPFHGDNTGSNPVWNANKINTLEKRQPGFKQVLRKCFNSTQQKDGPHSADAIPIRVLQASTVDQRNACNCSP
jgi:hypothetical protein